MQIKFNPKEVLAAVIGVLTRTVLSLNGTQEEIVKTVESVVQSTVNGFGIRRRTATEIERLTVAIRTAVSESLDSPTFELSESARKRILDVFSPDATEEYLRTLDKSRLLERYFHEYLISIDDCDLETLPIKKIVNGIVPRIEKMIRDDHGWSSSATYQNTRILISTLEDIRSLLQNTTVHHVDVKAALNAAIAQLEEFDAEMLKSLKESGLLYWILDMIIGVEEKISSHFSLEFAKLVLYASYVRSRELRRIVFNEPIRPKVYRTNVIEGFSTVDQWIDELIKLVDLTQLSHRANELFYRVEPDMKGAVSFATLAIFFTDLYLILGSYAEHFKDMIRYKTNANLDFKYFSTHIPRHLIKIYPDIDKRRVDVELVCSDPIAHKAAALFVNEFERALGGFEDVFSFIGFQVYYIRAKIKAISSDHVSNHNFEAYTPTLMPLLAGGHLYPTNLVFIRELLQNSVDSLIVRQHMDKTDFEKDIHIKIFLAEAGDQIVSMVISDHGMGMGRVEIERYLTSIGRSFYTANDFKKLRIEYKPISSFGIGFLSCFLVSDSIFIRTRKLGRDDESCELLIPNIEGCFFVEKSDKIFDIGTEMNLEFNRIDSEKIVYLTTLLEYIESHIVDIRFNIKIQWDKISFSKYTLCDVDGREFDVLGSDVFTIAKNKSQYFSGPHSLTRMGVFVDSRMSETFRKDWWNKHLRGNLKGISLVEKESNIYSMYLCRHRFRQGGSSFFIFIPLQENGNVLMIDFETIESTFEHPYGIFITDAAFAGKKLRNEEGGLMPCSGKLLFANAGILIDSAELRSLFGQEMRVYANKGETAYNNVMINLPPNWCELNVARDRIVKLSDSIDKRQILRGLAVSAVKSLNHILCRGIEVALVNIQEAATFFELVCSELNSDQTEQSKRMLIDLKGKRFVLKTYLNTSCIQFELESDKGEKLDSTNYLYETSVFREKLISKQLRDLFEERYGDFFREFENQLSKKRIESIAEFDDILAEVFGVSESLRTRLQCNLTNMLFSIYLILFPYERIAGKAGKFSHCSLSLEWQMIKKYKTNDFMAGRCSETILYSEIEQFIKDWCTK